MSAVTEAVQKLSAKLMFSVPKSRPKYSKFYLMFRSTCIAVALGHSDEKYPMPVKSANLDVDCLP